MLGTGAITATRPCRTAWRWPTGFQEAAVPVRDSKVPHGPALCFEAASWAVLIGELKADQHRP
ncbi:DUF397 domain-containing protein [Streptomyces sp. NPDC102270]|uniref:DUF397 domain-containing protein n=1 Tax=Streptomyces sp. NPDC102270 TaxID=3366150 RepID=UPI003810BA0A